MTTQSPKNNNRSHKRPFFEDANLEDTPVYQRPQLAPRHLLKREDVCVVEVRQRSQQLVWTVECRGEHYETSLRVLKRTAPQAVIDFLLANLRV